MLLLYGSLVLNARIDAEQDMYTVNSLFVGVFSNGDVLVQTDITPKLHASDVSLKLLGENVTNLSIKNYSSHDLPYYVNVKSNELTIKPQGSSHIRITYETSTLVNKEARLWTFSVNSTSPFTLKLANDAVVTSLGEHPPNLIRRLGGQDLLTFNPGQTTVKYILGYVGTKEQAEIAINSAEIDIGSMEKEHQGIRLNEPLERLAQSKIALNRGNFPEAESLATNSSFLVNKLSNDFELAKNSLNIATKNLKDAQMNNEDTARADKFISESRSQFAFGNYTAASELARMARDSIVPRTGINQQNIIPPVAIVSGIVLITVFVLLLYFKNRFHISVGYHKQERHSSRIAEHDKFQGIHNEEIHLDDEMARRGISDPAETVRKEVSQPKEKSELYQHVDRIISEHHDLKREDREVLYFLAQNKGAAFEAEIRTKFLLPKTSLWRLVKRLERLELIEITKPGGQNLIKLKTQSMTG